MAARTVLTTLRLAVACGAALAAHPASAQLAVPGVPSLPAGSLATGLEGAVRRTTEPLDQLAGGPLSEVRGLVRNQAGALNALLQAHPRELETDPGGWPILRGEVVATNPSEPAIAEALAAGFKVLRTEQMAALGLRVVTFAVPEGMPTSQALKRLRKEDPRGAYDYNHVHIASGAAQNGGGAPAQQMGLGGSIGLIDTGVDARHPVFADASIVQRGFAGPSAAGAHGTAVASLLVGERGVQGAAAGSRLFAADVYGGRGFGGSADAVARALGWIAGEGVPVVNVSLVGPRNAVVAASIKAAMDRGVVVVAAAGNGGPAAPPAYPAAYPGVVAVTGVDSRGRVLVEAGRGPHLSFAAPGADMAAADLSGGFVSVRGTSFAAPLVAGLLARRLRSPDVQRARQAVRQLQAQAQDLGQRGRDPVYGSGLVAAELRTPVPPKALRPAK